MAIRVETETARRTGNTIYMRAHVDARPLHLVQIHKAELFAGLGAEPTSDPLDVVLDHRPRIEAAARRAIGAGHMSKVREETAPGHPEIIRHILVELDREDFG